MDTMLELADQAMFECFHAVQCVFEDGTAEHRVCIFKDIVLWEGQLTYVAKGLWKASKLRVMTHVCWRTWHE